MSKLAFNVISDIHYYAKSVGITGPEFERKNTSSPMEMRYNEEILNALAEQLIEDETEIILLSGDTTHNGEPDSHAECVKWLQRLVDAGKKVFVITATHDYQDNGLCARYTENGKEDMPATSREELIDIYWNFGFAQALSVHRESQSYVARLAPGFRLFAINDDHNDDYVSGIGTDTLRWIDEQLKEANEAGDAVICMTHHPMVSPSPFYSLIGSGDMMHDHKQIRDHFADSGVQFFFTGHSHVQDISFSFSDRGNIFYDITTPAPAGYPGAYRHAVLDSSENKLFVEAVKIIKQPDFDTGGLSIGEYLQKKFFGMIGDMVKAGANDIDMFAQMADGMSIRPYVTYRFAWIIKPIVKILDKLKVKTAWKISKRENGLKRKDIEAVENDRVVDVIIELAQNLYGGDGRFTPNTEIYKITMGVCSVIDSIVRALHINLKKLLKGTSSVSELVEPLLYNSGICDAKATLDLNPAAKPELKEHIDSVKRSRKGPAILICAALLIIIFLPIEIISVLAAWLINKIKYRNKM